MILKDRMMINDTEVIGIARSEIANMSFVMTKSIHVPFSESFESGRVISETS